LFVGMAAQAAMTAADAAARLLRNNRRAAVGVGASNAVAAAASPLRNAASMVAVAVAASLLRNAASTVAVAAVNVVAFSLSLNHTRRQKSSSVVRLWVFVFLSSSVVHLWVFVFSCFVSRLWCL
jgi:hypothetical protein